MCAGDILRQNPCHGGRRLQESGAPAACDREDVEKAQKANLKTLDKIIDVVFPQVSTSFSSKDLIGIAANALSYQLGETQGFPYSIADTDVVDGYEGSYVVPSDFDGDVKKLHEFLFNEKDYQVSDTVKEISHEIDVMSGAIVEDGYTDEYGDR